jgi:hypothetical protein
MLQVFRFPQPPGLKVVEISRLFPRTDGVSVNNSLHRCLATSNIVDNPHSGVRDRTRRVCRWRPGMPARWSAAAFLEIEKSFRKIMGFRDLWALQAILDGSQPATRQAVA